jgi:peroxiredoxin
MRKIASFSLIALLFVAWTAFKPNKPEHQGLHIGEMAPDFNLKNIDGKMLGLKDIKADKGYIVIFTCNHCPFSKAYEDRIIDIDKKYKKMGYPVVAINPNDPAVNEEDSFDKMKERAKKKKFTFPYLFDEGQKVFPLYGATKTPHVFLLEKTSAGNKVAYIGAIDDNSEDAKAVKEKYLENAIDALSKGQAPNPSQTKAVGCSIKVKKS